MPKHHLALRIAAHLALLSFFATRETTTLTDATNWTLTGVLAVILGLTYTKRFADASQVFSIILVTLLVGIGYTSDTFGPGAIVLLVFTPTFGVFYWSVLNGKDTMDRQANTVTHVVLCLGLAAGTLANLSPKTFDMMLTGGLQFTKTPLGIIVCAVVAFAALLWLLQDEPET